MKHLFFRLYLLLILVFIGLGWSLDQLYDQFSADDQVPTDLDQHRGTLFLLNRELTRLPAESHQDYVAALAPSFGYPVSLLSETELMARLQQAEQSLTDEQRSFLLKGGQVAVIDDQSGLNWFLQKQTNTANAIVFGPMRLTAEKNNTLLNAAFLIIMALIVFVWVWPLSRGLMTLTKAAQRFGDGDFATRVSSHVAQPLQPVVKRFNAMAARIQRLIRSHKDLSHAVSHELRTPIARIRFAMEMTREVSDPSKRDYYFGVMNNNIEELDSLVDELLTYARFDREEPKLKIVPHNLVKLANNVVERFTMIEPQLTFTVDSDHLTNLVADCDHDAICRVLDNLLRNAVRYAHSRIHICIRRLETQIEVSIEDDGPGIPKAYWDNLFDPFVRLDKSRDRNSGGIGLGLAIVRRYMEWHHGQVSIANAEPQGAKFVLCWPLKQNQ